jgi:hypothetical protein
MQTPNSLRSWVRNQLALLQQKWSLAMEFDVSLARNATYRFHLASIYLRAGLFHYLRPRLDFCAHEFREILRRLR